MAVSSWTDWRSSRYSAFGNGALPERCARTTSATYVADATPRPVARSVSLRRSSTVNRTETRCSRPARSRSGGADSLTGAEPPRATCSSCLRRADSLRPCSSAALRTRVFVSKLTRQAIRASAATTPSWNECNRQDNGLIGSKKCHNSTKFIDRRGPISPLSERETRVPGSFAWKLRRRAWDDRTMCSSGAFWTQLVR
jgi:hypothetical protein